MGKPPLALGTFVEEKNKLRRLCPLDDAPRFGHPCKDNSRVSKQEMYQMFEFFPYSFLIATALLSRVPFGISKRHLPAGKREGLSALFSCRETSLTLRQKRNKNTEKGTL
jgi:hypothetical protein